MECTRCGKERNVIPIFKAYGHTFASPPSDFIPTAPLAESACAECITDREILLEVGPIAEFAIGVLLQGIDPKHTDLLVSLATARTCFMVRNNNPDGSARRAALRALGL